MGAAATETDLQTAIMDWGDRNRRDLPWRRTRDPWAVLVSELMLQQTQVARVAPRYAAFLARFPRPAACAGASVAEVVREWAGLGYNRRAVNLHRASAIVVARHGGSLPADVAELRRLPGVGPYTARAVMTFAFEADVGVVETNSARVLARAVRGRALGPTEAQTWADRLVPSGRGWAWNQAVLDLGAAVCRRRAPACPSCPLRATCAWATAGWPRPDPADGTGRQGVQSPFAGSDRQGRGRLIDVLRRGPLHLTELATAAGWPAEPARAHRVAAALVADGLARRDGDLFMLP